MDHKSIKGCLLCSLAAHLLEIVKTLTGMAELGAPGVSLPGRQVSSEVDREVRRENEQTDEGASEERSENGVSLVRYPI
jgi:hypothetical protein